MMIHPIFSLYARDYYISIQGLVQRNPLAIAGFLFKSYKLAKDFVDKMNLIKGNQQYLIALNTAKLQYKSIHAIECLYGVRR